MNLFVFFRRVETYVYFELTVPFKAYSEILVFKMLIRFVTHNAKHLSVLLPTTRKSVPCCGLQCPLFFRILGNNAEKCSIFSSCVFFRFVTQNAIIFLLCEPRCQKWSALLPTPRGKWTATMQKNVRFKYRHAFKYLQKLETIGEFTLGFQSGA